MPTYTFNCDCGKSKDVFRSMSKKDAVLCDCGKSMNKSFSGTGSFFVEGSTPSKAWKEKRVRHKKNASLSLKQIEKYGSGPRLTPNVGGVETDNWEDASALAKESGIDTAGYEAQVRAAKNKNNSQGIDESKWKKAKEELKRV